MAWRRSLLGGPAHPNGLAKFVHELLNRLPVERFPILACRGPLGGFRMRVDWTTQRSFAYGTWEPAVTKVIQARVRPGMTALDIGAHVGFYTLLLAKLVSQSGRVISFEPMPNNFARLVENVGLNQLEQVTLVNLAVLARSQEIQANVPPGEPYSGSISLHHDYGTPRISVRATSLDEYLAGLTGRLDFAKIDVEGAEAEVLEGGVQTLKRLRPALLVELHHFDGNVSANVVPKLLPGMGYRVTWLERWEMSSYILATPEEAS